MDLIALLLIGDQDTILLPFMDKIENFNAAVSVVKQYINDSVALIIMKGKKGTSVKEFRFRYTQTLTLNRRLTGVKLC